MDILISEDLDAPAIQQLSQKYQLQRDPMLWKDPGSLEKQAREARVLMVRNQTQVTAQLLAAAPRLLGIGRVGVGLDNIDVEAATRAGAVVIAPLNANATSVAELTLGLILALARKIPAADKSTKAGAWDRKAGTGIELEGKTLLVCGFGRIGRLVAARARAFGLRLVVYDPFIRENSPALAEVGARYCSKLEEALPLADFVTMHLPLTAESRQMLNGRAFAAMKPGAFLINTSRGGVVDEAALLAALQRQHLAGAALDVRQAEPPARSEFETLDNVILTPHIGAFTREAQARTFDAVCDDLDRVLSGKPAIHFVNMAEPKKAARL